MQRVYKHMSHPEAGLLLERLTEDGRPAFRIHFLASAEEQSDSDAEAVGPEKSLSELIKFQRETDKVMFLHALLDCYGERVVVDEMQTV